MKRRKNHGSRAPSITAPFAQARALLDVGADADRRTIKRAYRDLVARHPPDRDPDAFRKIRDAYELLTNPLERTEAILMEPIPRVAFPPVKAGELPAPGALALDLLRAYASQLDARALLGEEPS